MDPRYESELREGESAIKQRLRHLGRSLKKIDLHGRIVAHPFAAAGIAALAGAIAGLARPMPHREPHRMRGALVTVLGAIGYRLVREAAVRELGNFAKNYVRDMRDRHHDIDREVAERERRGRPGIRYTPNY